MPSTWASDLLARLLCKRADDPPRSENDDFYLRETRDEIKRLSSKKENQQIVHQMQTAIVGMISRRHARSLEMHTLFHQIKLFKIIETPENCFKDTTKCSFMRERSKLFPSDCFSMTAAV
jgi:hypothetical protein